MQELENELNNKNISLNKLNNEYERKIKELIKKLNDISLSEYTKRLAELDNRHKQEIKKLESDLKDKNKAIKKINELNKEKQEYAA